MDLLANLHRFEDFENPAYYNIRTFRQRELEKVRLSPTEITA
jgi:hypothetical protein